ncbi:MAG TPA: hypothetical protein VE422_10240 [Terriglobia bacterium]|nr:hypothetical protein [Terriglobia bacterium]
MTSEWEHDIVGIIGGAPPISKMGIYSELQHSAELFHFGQWLNVFFYWADLNGVNY